MSGTPDRSREPVAPTSSAAPSNTSLLRALLAYAEDETVAKNVGFYYMANAGGRLLGTILSGAVYQWLGLEGCLWFSVALVLIAATISLWLPGTPRLSGLQSIVSSDTRRESHLST